MGAMRDTKAHISPSCPRKNRFKNQKLIFRSIRLKPQRPENLTFRSQIPKCSFTFFLTTSIFSPLMRKRDNT